MSKYRNGPRRFWMFPATPSERPDPQAEPDLYQQWIRREAKVGGFRRTTARRRQTHHQGETMADLKLDEAKLLKMVDAAEARAKSDLAHEAEEIRKQVKEAAAALRDLPAVSEVFSKAIGLGTITVPPSQFDNGNYPVAVNVQIDNQSYTAVSFVRPRDQKVRVLVVVLPIEEPIKEFFAKCHRTREFFGEGNLEQMKCASCGERASIHAVRS